MVAGPCRLPGPVIRHLWHQKKNGWIQWCLLIYRPTCFRYEQGKWARPLGRGGFCFLSADQQSSLWPLPHLVLISSATSGVCHPCHPSLLCGVIFLSFSVAPLRILKFICLFVCLFYSERVGSISHHQQAEPTPFLQPSDIQSWSSQRGFFPIRTHCVWVLKKYFLRPCVRLFEIPNIVKFWPISPIR